MASPRRTAGPQRDHCTFVGVWGSSTGQLLSAEGVHMTKAASHTGRLREQPSRSESPPELATSRDAVVVLGGPAFPAARASHMVLQSAVSGSLIKSAGMATMGKRPDRKSTRL